MLVSSSILLLCLGLERLIGESSEEVWDMELEEVAVFWKRGRVVGVSLMALAGSLAEAGRTMGGRGGPNICLGERTWIVCL